MELIKKGGIGVDSINDMSLKDLISRKIKNEDKSQLNIFDYSKTAERVTIESENIFKENNTEYNKPN